MPSFGYGVNGSAPNRRGTFVSFLQNNRLGGVLSGPWRASSSSGPRNGCSIAAAESAAAFMAGRGAPSSQDQVLRNQAVGSTCTVAGSGPALVTEIVISRSSALALA